MPYKILRQETENFSATNAQSNGERTSVTLADGRVVMLTSKYNNVEDSDDLQLWEVSADKSTSTLKATITNFAGHGNLRSMQLARVPDDSGVAIFWLRNSQKFLHYFPVTISGGTYTVGSGEQILSLAGSQKVYSWDADISDSGIPMVVVNRYNGSSITRIILIVRRSSDSTWHIAYGDNVTTDGDLAPACDAASIVCLGNPSGTIRDVVWAYGTGKHGNDQGIRIATLQVDESDGAVTNFNVRDNIFGGSAFRWRRGTFGARVVRLFRVSADEYVCAAAHSERTLDYGFVRGTFANNVWTETSKVKKDVFGHSGIKSLAMSCDGATKTINFYYATTWNLQHVRNKIAKWSGTGLSASADFSGLTNHYRPWLSNYISSVGSHGQQSNILPEMTHDVAVQIKPNNSTVRWEVCWADIPETATNPVREFTPLDGVLTEESNPVLSAKVNLGYDRLPSAYAVEFRFATDAAYTSNAFVYQTLFRNVTGGGTESNLYLFSERLPSPYSLSAGTWYWSARVIDWWDNVSEWTDNQTLLVGHPPTLHPTNPANGNLVYWNGGVVSYNWLFTDPAESDSQSAFQIQVYEADTDALVQDSGKIVSTDQVYQMPALDPSYKDVSLYWIVRGWDLDDAAGPYSEPGFFVATDPPSISIDSPTNDQIFTSGVPTFTFTPTTSGGRKIKSFEAVITQSGVPVWSARDSGVWDSGEQRSVKVSQGYLQDVEFYSLQIKVTDDANLVAYSDIRPFSIDWTPPAAPTGLDVDDTAYNLESDGYISVTWTDDARDPDFLNWIVYRKDDLLNPNTLAVVEEGEYRVVYIENGTSDLYEFRDYFAPSGYRVTYRISQLVDREGHEVESTSVPEVISPNLYPDPSFESGESWTSRDGSDEPALSTTHVLSGTNALHISRGAGTNEQYGVHDITSLLTTAGDYTLTLNIYIPASLTDDNGIQIDVNGNTVKSIPVLTRDDFEEVVTTFTWDGLATVEVVGYSVEQAGEAWIDDAELTRGNQLVGVNPTAQVTPISEGYWIIEPSLDSLTAEAFKLHQVVSDSFTDEQEEAEFTVVGRGRVVQKGTKMGVKGTLECQLRDTGGITARQKRLRLKEIQVEGRRLWMRNPFGDIFPVNVGGMSISRLAGVGINEFCDVSVPYGEIS